MVTYIQGNGTPGPSPSPTAEEIDAALLGKKKSEEKKPVEQPAVAVEPKKEEVTTRVMEPEPVKPSYRTRAMKTEKTEDKDG